jgi:TRAP-type C4-dicarboxylate transport system substrate-binding protein
MKLAASSILTALIVAACAPAPPPAAAPTSPPAAGTSASAAAAKPGTQAVVRKEGPSFAFKFASPSPEADLSGEGYKYWAKLVDERTGGRIKFQFFWAGSLLNATSMFAGVRDGLVDFAAPAMSYVSGQVPDVALFEVPFAYPTESKLMLPFYREVEPILNDVFAKDYNQRVVWASPSTTPDPVTCRDKFLDSERAWQGALVRVAGKWQTETLTRWGAKPVVIDLGEAYTALQRGTADCLLLVYNLLDSFKLYEVAKNVTRIDHSINLVAVTANNDAWNRLPVEDQQILLGAGREAQEYVDQVRTDLVTRTIDKFKGQGVKVCTPTQQELNRLRGVTEPILGEIGALQTERGHRIQDIAKNYRAQVTKWGPTEGDTTPCTGAG